MNRFYPVLISVFALIACTNSEKGFTIEGEISNLPEGTWVYLYDTELGRNIQKAILTDGKVRFFGEVKGFRQFYIHNGNFETYRSLWIKNEDYTVTGIGDYLEEAQVEGPELQKQGDLWEKEFKPMYRKLENLTSRYDSNQADYLKQQQEALREQIQQKQIEFISKNRDFDVCAFYLFDKRYGIDKTQIQDLFENLTASVQANYWGEKVDLYLNHARSFGVGDTILNIELPNQNGVIQSLNGLDYKYVLVEFWESSCNSCQKENLSLSKIYKKYHSEGLEIYAVCLDREKATWQNAIERDHINWITVSDLEGLNGNMAIIYNISYMPTNYLLDENGIIIQKDLKGQNLLNLLDSLLL